MSDFTIEPDGHDGFDVYEHGVYERSSVLAGQDKRSFRDNFDSVDAALTAFPDASVLSCSSKSHFDPMPQCAPSWFDPADAGECWHEDDY